ncbi:MAG: hypothetical protein WCJ30_18775, partial [Deltaproteobacteria bacterium]
MIPFTIVFVMLTRKLRSVWRNAARLAWAVLLGGLGLAAVYGAKSVLRRNPDVNPFIPGGVRLGAIELFTEAFFVTSLVWLPKLFDVLEDSGAEMLVAVRQLRSRKSGFLTWISFLAFLGVGLSSFGLCFTISIMGGFGNDLKRKILGNNAHIVVDHDREGIVEWRPLVRRIAQVRGVASATPLVQGEVMVTSQTNLSGVLLRGIDPASGGPVGNLRRELIRGRVEYITEP